MTSVTILRVQRGHLATKRWAPHPVTGEPELHGFDAGTWFRAERVEVTNIYELSALLARLERDPTALIIRGEPLPGVDLRRVRRLKHRRKSGNNEVGPFFGEPSGGLPFALIDFDKVEVPDWVDPIDDPEAAVEYLVGLLPDYFQDVTYHWQLSSSAGMGTPGVLSAHIWFWLDRDVTEAELTVWGLSLAVAIDVSLFRTVQPHYTAAPIFDGVRDPLPRRSGLRVGLTDAVTLPAIDLARPRYATGSTGAGLHWARGFEAKLELLGDGDGLRGFHNPLLAASAAYVYRFGAEGTDIEALKTRMREAVHAAPKGTSRASSDIDRYMSDGYLDQLIQSAIEKYGTARAEREAEEAERAAPPYWPTTPLPLEQAVELLNRTIAEFFDQALAGGKPRTGIRASAGMGKTRRVIHELAQRPTVTRRVIRELAQRRLIQDLNIEIYTPDHKLAAEWCGNLAAAAPHLRVLELRGRSHTDASHPEPLCKRAEMAHAVAQAGEPVYETLCERQSDDEWPPNEDPPERCPYFEACSESGYLAQFADKGPAVRIMPSAYLPLPRGKLLPKPKLVIIDERFWPEAISQRDIGLDRLATWRFARQHDHSGAGALRAAFRLEHQGRLVLDALLDGKPLLAAMRKARHNRETLNELARAEYATIENLHLSPSLSDEVIRRKLKSVEKAEVFARSSLWRILRDEIDTGRDEAHGVELRRSVPRGGGERQHRLYLHSRKKLPPLAGAPVLDADLNREIVGQLVPGLKVVNIEVERSAEVIQVRDTASSKRRLLGLPDDMTDRKRAATHIAEIRDLLAVEGDGGKRVLVVTYLPVRRLLTGEDETQRLPPGAPLKGSKLLVEVAHFGSIRGQDRWRHFDTVVVIGRHQPPPLEAEGLARALYYDQAEPLTFLQQDENGALRLPSVRRGYRMRDGQHADAAVEVHPDPDVQAVIEQLREDEAAQAIDRLRLIHNDAPKRVVILSNLPLDLTVDQLVRWRDIIPSRPKLVVLTAVAVPLSFRELARCFPQVWVSAAAARSELQRRRLIGIEALKEYLLEVRYQLAEVEYRRPHRPGPAMRALVSGPSARLQATLESVVGPVSRFRLLTAETTKPEVTAPAALNDGRSQGVPGQLTRAEGDRGNDDARPPAPEVQAGAPESPSSDLVDALPANEEAFEERAALTEYLAGVHREIAEEFARLDPDRPRGDIPPHVWVEIIDGAGRFIDSPMLANALALGWTVHDLFGCDDRKPYARLDQSGLLLDLRDGRVVFMTEDLAIIEKLDGTRHSWPRLPRNPGRRLIWEVAEPRWLAVIAENAARRLVSVCF